jgi:glycine cleavage system aminomethyltransferase T
MRRLCRQHCIFSVISRRRGRGLRPGPAVHDDLVRRDFTADAPNELWLTDITEHTDEGKLDLLPVVPEHGFEVRYRCTRATYRAWSCRVDGIEPTLLSLGGHGCDVWNDASDNWVRASCAMFHWMLRLEENKFWLSLADSDVALWAKGLVYNSGLNVTIQEVDVAPVQIQGPKSKELMVELFGERILNVPYYYMSEDIELDGMRVCVSRTGYTSELGYEIYLYDATKNGVKLWNTVLEAGKAHDLRVIGPCHMRRIEGGILAFGCDIWYDTNPFEVDMGYSWMVDLDQEADFIGKEALARIKAEGARRKLVGVEIEGRSVGTYIDNEMLDVYPIFDSNEQRIGNVTSACYSPRLEKNIGFAMLPIEQADMGNRFEVETQHGRAWATTVPKPFIDPKKEIPKQ